MEKKKVLTAVAVGAATVAASVGASQVHADSVTVTKQQVGDETKVTTTTVKDNTSQAKIAKDKQAVSDQQNVVNKAKASMDSAQSKVDQDSANTAAAQKKVDDAKSKLDSAKANTDPAQIKNKINSDQQQISNDQSQISDVKNNISVDQSKIAQDKQNINNVGQVAKDDQAKLSSAKQALSNAQSKEQKQAGVVSSTENQINTLKNEASQSNVPNIPNADDMTAEINALIQGNNAMAGNDGGFENYHFNGDDYQINPFNLTASQQKEIDEFAAAYLNKWKQYILDKYGSMFTPEERELLESQATSSSNADKFASDLSNYVNQKHAVTDPDTDDGLASYYPGLESKYGLNMTHGWSSGDFSGCRTMSDLKNAVMGAIDTQMMDSTHMTCVFDNVISVTVNGQGCKGAFINGTYAGTKNIVPTIGDFDYVGYTPESKVQNRESLPGSDVQSQINSLENQLQQQKAQLTQDQNAVASAQQAVNNAQSRLSQDTPAGLTDQLNKDQQQLANDQAKLSNLQKDLADAQNQLIQDQNALKNVNSPAAQAALAQAQQDYANAVKDLNDAQSQENTDRAALAQFQQDYANAIAKLNELETILKNDEGETTTVSVQWIKNQHPTTTSEIGNQYVLNSRTGNSTVKFGSMDEVQAAEIPGLRRSNRNNGLPDTGDSQSSAASVAGLLGLGLAGILSMFGLAELKKRE